MGVFCALQHFFFQLFVTAVGMSTQTLLVREMLRGEWGKRKTEDFYNFVCSVVSLQPLTFTPGEWSEGALWSSHGKVRACRQRWQKVSLCVFGSNSALPVCWSVNKVSMFAPKAS